MKFTFEDWKSGKVTIETTYSAINNGEETIIVNWKHFEDIEKEKISSEQKNIFTNLCQKEYDLIIGNFESRYQKSHFKEELIKKEIKKLKELLFDDTPTNSVNSIYNWGNFSPFNFGEDVILKQIRNFFSKCYIEGYTLSFDFVNSPDSPYCINYEEFEPMPEVQGEVLYRFYNYLLQLTYPKTLNFDNQYWNLKSFQLFKFLSIEFPNTNTISKYNLIFHFLKELNNKGLTPYYFSMKKEEYFKFITENVNANFISNKGGRPTMNPPETDLKDTAFNGLYSLKDDFELMQ